MGTVAVVTTGPHAPRVRLQFFSVAPSGVGRALVHMATDVRRLRGTPGLLFVKALGTSRGFDVRTADPTTWGLLTVWTDQTARRDFGRTSGVPAAWSALAEDECHVDLVPLRSRGAWSGSNPFLPVDQQADRSGPVAAITRARLRPRRAMRFWRASPPVADAVDDAAGLLLSIGIGEAPVGLQGTFSLWRDASALTSFAYDAPAHRRVIADTARLGWYAEDLFARFAVEEAAGRIHGRDLARLVVAGD